MSQNSLNTFVGRNARKKNSLLSRGQNHVGQIHQSHATTIWDLALCCLSYALDFYACCAKSALEQLAKEAKSYATRSGMQKCDEICSISSGTTA